MAIVDKPTNYFNTKLFSGNGSGGHAITGVGFAPDWVWLKNRSSVTLHHLYDTIRGAEKMITSVDNRAESTQVNALTAFGSDGFTVGSDADVNGNGNGIVSWNWKAGGSASSNSNGSITTSISANQDSGFSMVSYTGNNSNGATIGHGLGAAPNMVIIKKKSSTAQWAVGGTNIDSTFNGYMFLDSTGSIATSDNVFNDTAPSSSVVTLGTTGDSNANGETYIAYCFAQKNGFSKFGSYVGNGSTSSGTFVYTGFKVAWVMTKSIAVEAWQMTDHVRDANVSPNFARLVADINQPENTNTTWAKVEKFSNGFKLGGNDGVSNGSGQTYIYMAFAENPFVTSTDNGSIPACAR